MQPTAPCSMYLGSNSERISRKDGGSPQEIAADRREDLRRADSQP